MSNDLLVALVLDKSGSMDNTWSDPQRVQSTLRGVNSFIEEQTRSDGKTLLTLTLFDTRIEPRFVAANATDVPQLGNYGNEYKPGGGTALYDAVGVTMTGVEQWQKNNQWFDGKVLVVIYTDGQENSSRQYGINDLNRFISDKQEKANWEFIFLGAGGAAWTEGRKFTAIPVAQRVFTQNDSASIDINYAAVSNTASILRGGGGMNTDGYARSE